MAAQVGVHVMVLPRGKTLFHYQSQKKFIPASLVKLLTSYAALKELGPDYTFKTEVWAGQRPRKGIVPGSLWIKGFGDPYLTPERFWLLARKVRSLGIRRVLGGIHVDNTAFRPPWEHLCIDGKCARSHNPVVSATAVNFNTVTFQIVPKDRKERGAEISVFPPTDYAEVRAKWRKRRSRRLAVSFSSLGMGDDGREIFQVRGKAPPGAFVPVEQRINVRDPQKFVALTFRKYLEDAGVTVTGASVSPLPVPKSAQLLLSFKSPPLRDLLFGLNRYSNNFMAEMLLRVLGGHVYGLPCTRKKGCRAVDTVLRRLGASRSEVRLDSGSGLTRTTHVSPRVFNLVLKAAYNDFVVGPEFMASLARPGEDGTLRRRMKNAPRGTVIRGKTGTLKDVVSFSGYVVSPSKKTYAVTIILNGVKSIWKARQALDAFVEQLPALAG